MVDTFGRMQDLASLPKDQLLDLFKQQDVALGENVLKLQCKDEQLATKDGEITTQADEIARKSDIIKQLEQKVQELELAFDKLWRERFESRSERYIGDPAQLRLDFGDTDDAADAADGLADALEDADLIPAHRRRKPRKKRDEGLPEHLPRVEVTADIPEEDKNCETHGERTLLPEEMWDKTETLEFRRPELWVRVTKYPKYACPGQPECGIGSPERPTGIVELQRYLDDPSIPIDNNETEQLMKQVAIGRKNWLFAGSVAGGERSAGFLTLASSALRNDLDVWRYVKDVLDQLLAGMTDYEPLLPWNWAAAHPDAIRQYRVTERHDRAEKKRAKRENRRRQKTAR